MIKQLKFFCFSVLIAIIASSGSLTAKTNTLEQPASGKNGMVSTQEAIASRVGVEILKQGGNAIDAAVAVGFALAVTYPRAGNLGGGGFMLIYKANDKLATAIDYREMAPKAAFRDMFLDEKGNVDNQKARFSALSSGIPGTVAGLVYALEKYGTMNLKQAIKPALDLASDGFIVPDELYRSFKVAKARLSKISTTREIYYPDGGEPRAAGKLLKQPELASVLQAIHDKGRAGFYNGAIAKLISEDSLNNGGIITLEDLANYQVAERQPVQGTYRGHNVISMPPPSSGGIHLIQMLNVLENWDMKASKLNTALTVNRMVETMKRAYSDRSKHLGDPRFYDVPIAQLTDKRYAKDIFQAIEAKQVTPSDEIRPGELPVYESQQTTHYTVMDKFGNAVANTYTLNASFGNGRVAKGTGILMNNEMDDFSSKPGVPNMFGLLGGEANAIEAGKRPLSSMSPTIIVKDERPLLATGSVGGSRIITTVLQILVNIMDHDMDILTATTSPRFHHQWYPDNLIMESGFNPDVLTQLRTMGYSIDAPELLGHEATPAGTEIGYLQSVLYRDGVFTGAADPRRPNSLAVGY